MDENAKQSWSLIIRSKTPLLDLNLKELWRYKDLIRMFVLRDFTAVYKQTILGPIWYIIQPLITTIIYAIIFKRVPQMSSEGQPKMLFYMSGLLLWNYFSVNLIKNSETFYLNAGLFGKVYFPRLTVPIATTISGLLALFFQFLLLIFTYVYFIYQGANLQLKFTLILFPYLLFLVCILSMSLGIIVSSLTTKYRDLKHLVSFGIQLAMWVTPVLYPISQFYYSKLYHIIRLNPMSAIIETFRYSIFGTGTLNWYDLLYSSLFTLITLVIGIIIFNKTEKHFIDNI